MNFEQKMLKFYFVSKERKVSLSQIVMHVKSTFKKINITWTFAEFAHFCFVPITQTVMAAECRSWIITPPITCNSSVTTRDVTSAPPCPPGPCSVY